MNTTRRHFLRNTGLAGAALGFPTIIPARELGADAPSKKINILQIGCGRIGRDMDMPGILRQNAARPFFAFLHTYEPHAPYMAPEPFRSRYADPYDAEVAASDGIVGQFLEGLRKDGLYDRALILFLSDHGEGLGDHGEQQHGIFLYRESIQVPLLVKIANEPDRVSCSVSAAPSSPSTAC